MVNEKFGVKIPEGYPLEAAGPVMCAGVTMYDPLSVNKAENGTRVGIVGLGGRAGSLFTHTHVIRSTQGGLTEVKKYVAFIHTVS